MSMNIILLNTRLRFAALTLAALLTTAAAAPAQEKLPPDAKVVRLEVLPRTIDLKHPFDYQQVVLTAVLQNGDRMDVTRIATAEAPAPVAKMSPQGMVRPVADGNGSLKFTLANQSV